MLTPRQMARKQAELEKATTDDHDQEPESTRSWLGQLIARLLGRK
jgi:hypothetical protein